MIITGMAHFESVCKNKLVEWYNQNSKEQITLENVFVVWACKTLQNYKALLSTTIEIRKLTDNHMQYFLLRCHSRPQYLLR